MKQKEENNTMASVYGVEVKNVRRQTDHEGCALYSADVWYNGKKLGHWSQDYWCGLCRTDFNESLLDDAVEKYRNSDLVEEHYKAVIDADILMNYQLPCGS